MSSTKSKRVNRDKFHEGLSGPAGGSESKGSKWIPTRWKNETKKGEREWSPTE